MRPQELNLLVVFDAIMTERSITRAADRLAMTQPAVSNAVGRMRVAWKDELFVKDGRNIQPTLHAQNLWSQVREPLGALNDAIEPKAFVPSSAKRTFRVATTDIAVEMIWVQMRQIIEKQAPNINLHAIPYTIINAEQVLEDAEVDLVIGAAQMVSSTFRQEFLFNPDYVCVMRKDHPLAKANITLEEFAAADHLLVSLSGDTTGYTDEILLQHGLSRRIACTVNHFSSVTKLIKNSDLISVVPTGAVADAIVAGELAATLPPLEYAPQNVVSLWHKRQDKDAGLIWLRKHIKELISKGFNEQSIKVKQSLCKHNPALCNKAKEAHMKQMDEITIG